MDTNLNEGHILRFPSYFIVSFVVKFGRYR